MAESSTHMRYVLSCGEFIKRNILPAGRRSFLLVDKPDTIEKPPAVEGGVRPDLYYRFSNLLVIGEAKTYRDIDNQHSRTQYDYYFKESELFGGESYLVFYTDWAYTATMWTIIKKMKEENGYKAHVYIVSEMGIYRKMM